MAIPTNIRQSFGNPMPIKKKFLCLLVKKSCNPIVIPVGFVYCIYMGNTHILIGLKIKIN